jgi:hypothetical protein
MKRVFFLAATLFTALPPVIALAVTVQSNLAITVTPSQGGGSILPADRDASANWARAGMLSVGGIPNRTTQCGSTISPSGGDDTSKIQGAINACPVGDVVQLSAGTFNVSEGNYLLINKGITLRGSGPGNTILTRTGGATLNSGYPGSNPSPIIVVGPGRYGATSTTGINLSTDGAKGSYSVQLTSTAGLSVGQVVELDEASGASYRTDPLGFGQIWAAPDWRVVWQKHNPSVGWDDFDSSTYPYTAGSTGCYYSRCDRPTSEYHQIANISGTTVTFDSPLTISYRVSHTAELWYSTPAFVANAGVENLSVSHGDSSNLTFIDASNSWAQNVESSLYLNGGIVIAGSFRVQLEEVYVHDAAWAQPGGAGYNIDINWGSSEILVENSISVLANKVMVIRSAGAGCVIAYNYMDDGFINTINTWQEIGVNGSHATGSHATLFEGNESFNGDSDNTHGNSIYMVYYQNYFSGYRRQMTDPYDGSTIDDINNIPGGNGPLRAIGAMAYSYWETYIGNVLGTSGHTAGWVYDSTVQTQPGIWMLGWDGNGNLPNDPNVASEAYRHGKFDYLRNTVTWDPNNSNHTLVNSLYLTQTPTFFNAGRGYAWPWVNPTGSPQLYTLPAKARYDAGTPFTQP